MSTYELILSIDDSTFTKLMSSGLLRTTVKRDVQVYEFFLNECNSCGKMQARTNTAEQFSISEDSVSKIIQKMKK